MTREDFNMMVWASSRHPNSPYNRKAKHRKPKFWASKVGEETIMAFISMMFFITSLIIVYLYC